MAGTQAPPLTVVRPGEGRAGDLGPIGVVFKLWGQDTGGALSVVEHPFAVGALVPPHVHTREDEYSIVTEGEIGFRSGDPEVVLGAGGYITKPRGELHAMWNAGKVPARMIEIISPAGFEGFFGALAGARAGVIETISPAGFEGFFRELADLAAAGPPPFDQIATLAANYGLEFGDAAWLPDIIARYQLSPAAEPRPRRSKPR